MERRAGWVALITATSTVVGFTYAGHAAVAPLVAAEFALDDVQLGLIATALFLAASATMLAAGNVADRFPPKSVNSVALALVLVGNAGLAAAPTYPLLLAARAVGGVGAGLALLAGLRYVALRYADARPHFGHGLYGAGFPLGSAIALWVTPPLALALGWRGAYSTTSLAMLLVLLLWLRARPVPRMERPGSVIDAARSPNCWWTAVQHAAGFGLVLAAGTWISVYLLRDFALPLEASGLLGSLLLVLAVLARPVGGFVVSRERLTTLAVMRGAQLTILAGIALLAWPGRPLAVALLGAIAVGFGGGVPYAAVFNTAAASLPRAPSAAQSLTGLGGLLAVLVGAPAMGYAIQTWGFSAAWLLLGAIAIAALAGTFLMRGEEDFDPSGRSTR